MVGKLLGELVTDMFGMELVGRLDEVVRNEVVRESFELELVGEKKVGKKQSVAFVLTVDLLVVLYRYWFE